MFFRICKKALDKNDFLDYNYIVAFAGVAQSVVQLIRNQQVVCSSHITSSNNQERNSLSWLFFYTDYCIFILVSV